ncbi:hypothetical protein [Sphingomonas sp.]|jgi:hypothetical protein|uniref:hypothetical protein n=1 Tax=Sphingomonas sp. TaxID=28214 RepID=UPI002D805CA5|nr:hypothetical protein [Sphingomonas sp.]HEU0044238.1 hypothetical protein [Sphingomonas sp.]
MAYVDFSADPPLGPTAGAPRHDAISPRRSSLTALEWSVVALSRRDTLASLDQPGRLATALGTVFGPGFGGARSNPRLADPKLEALRRMAVWSWRRGVGVPASELRAFLAAGFSAAQHETLLASIAAARSRAEAGA